MKNRNKVMVCAILAVFSAKLANAQSGANTAGVEATGSGGKVNASVGQVFTNTNTSALFYTVEGVQQPYEISVITSNEELHEMAGGITVYPNPFIDGVNIKLEKSLGPDTSYLLTDFNGKAVKQGVIESDITSIDAALFARGTYLLSILNGNTLTKSYKIIKN
jgi:hypothetical protein